MSPENEVFTKTPTLLGIFRDLARFIPTHDLSACLDQVATCVAAADYPYVALYILEPSQALSRKLINRAQASGTTSPPTVNDQPLPLGVGLPGYAAQTNRTFMVNDLTSEPLRLEYLDPETGHVTETSVPSSQYVPIHAAARSALCAPIGSGTSVLGAINIESPVGNAFAPADLALLRPLSQHIGSVITTTRLLGQLRIAETVGAKGVSLDPDELLDFIANTVKEAFEYEHVSIFFVDEMKKKYVKKHMASKYERPPKGYEQDFEVGIISRPHMEKKPWVSGDVSSDRHYHMEITDTVSELAVPIIIDDVVRYIINVESDKRYRFDEADVAALQSVANLYANAVKNAQMYHQDVRQSVLDRLCEASVDPVVAIDMDGTITHFNKAAESLLGYSRDEVVGRMNVVNLYESEAAARNIGKKLWEESSLQRVRTHVKKKGSPSQLIPIDLSASFLQDESGRPIGSVGIFEDATLKVKLESVAPSQARIVALSRRVDLLLNICGNIMASAQEPRRSLEQAIVQLAKFTESHASGLFCLRGKGRQERLGLVAAHAGKGEFRQKEFRKHEGIIGEVVRKDEVRSDILLPNAMSKEQVVKAFGYEGEMMSYVCVPVRIRGVASGSLLLLNPKDLDRASENDYRGLLRAVATLLGMLLLQMEQR